MPHARRCRPLCHWCADACRGLQMIERIGIMREPELLAALPIRPAAGLYPSSIATPEKDKSRQAVFAS
jgi:hypothetical protein